MEQTKLKLGISSCLLGNNVRYDGGHKYDNWLVETLGEWVDYVPVCPELECGLPVPREAMRLVGDIDNPRLLTQKSGIDHTERMQAYSSRRVAELSQKELCGFVFKSRSPSSGMERVKVYPAQGGAAVKKGVGMFAKVFMQANPLLPCEEEGRLHDPVLRENFIERIFVQHRWQSLQRNNPTVGSLVSFHTAHKLLIMAHSVVHYRSMGKLVASASKAELGTIMQQYYVELMAAMAKPATPSKHQNVMMHILGYFKHDIDGSEKEELLQLINRFKEGLLPLIVPITMLNHYTIKYQKEYLAGQIYLNPHPIELKLRNHC